MCLCVFHSIISYPFFSLLSASDPYTLGFSQSEYRVVEDNGALDVTVTVDRPPAFDVPFTVVASVTGSGPDYAARKYVLHYLCYNMVVVVYCNCS